MEHVRNCARCQGALRDLSALVESKRRDAHPAIPREVDEAVMAAVDRILEGAPQLRRVRRVGSRRVAHAATVRRRRALWALPAAAAAAVLLLGLLWTRGRPEEEERLGKSSEHPVCPAETPTSVEERIALAGERVAEPMVGIDPQQKVEEEAPEGGARLVAEAAGESREVRRAAEQPEASPVKTVRAVARVAQITGSVYFKRQGAGKWFKAMKDVRLEPGDSLDTRMGRALVELQAAGRAFCNRNTWIVLEAARLRLCRGEVCCEFERGAAGFEVATADGVVRHLGTRFSVKVLPSGTTVTVEEGEVEVENDQGRARVSEGFRVWLRKGHAPSRPREADAAGAVAWTRKLYASGALFCADFAAGWPSGLEFVRKGEKAGSRSPLPGQPFLSFDEGRAVATWRGTSPRWSWGDFRLSRSFPVKEPVAGSVEVRLSQVTPNLAFILTARLSGPDGTGRLVRFMSRGGTDRVDSGSHTKVLWMETVGDGALSPRKVELVVGPREAALSIDGVEKFRAEHGLAPDRVRFGWSCGFKLDRAPASVEVGNVSVRKVQ